MNWFSRLFGAPDTDWKDSRNQHERARNAKWLSEEEERQLAEVRERLERTGQKLEEILKRRET